MRPERRAAESRVRAKSGIRRVLLLLAGAIATWAFGPIWIAKALGYMALFFGAVTTLEIWNARRLTRDSSASTARQKSQQQLGSLNPTTWIDESTSVTWLDRDTVEVRLGGKSAKVFVDYSDKGFIRVWRVVDEFEITHWNGQEQSTISNDERATIIDTLNKYYNGRLIVIRGQRTTLPAT